MSDVVVVGAGFFGSTVARTLAEQGFRVRVLERRPHLAGNAYSYRDDATGVDVHKYGSHIFHTSNPRIWSFVNRFAVFNSYVHIVRTMHHGRSYNLPINLSTMSSLFEMEFTPEKAAAYFRELTGESVETEFDSFEEAALRRIGRPLFEAFISGYTRKQWDTPVNLLPASIFRRLPVRLNHDARYFSDAYQGIPKNGYTALIERMLDHERIEVNLNCDYLESKFSHPGTAPSATVYSGPIDEYFNYQEGRLQWRTLQFEFESLETKDFQGIAVMNYADDTDPWTRIHEFRHLHPERSHENSGTIIAREYSRWSTEGDEPYYPVDTEDDKDRLQRYKNLAAMEDRVWFGGRLGSYRYLDMHMAIGSAFRTSSSVAQAIRIGSNRSGQSR